MICAPAYIRLTFEYEDKISRHAAFVIAKIRTKSEAISLPTAELLSIKDGTNIAKIVQRLFGISKKDTHYYNDSSIAIQKIRNADRNGILSVNASLAPSIKKVLDNIESPSTHLHHFPSKKNIADIGRRPVIVRELQENTEWFRGPNFI